MENCLKALDKYYKVSDYNKQIFIDHLEAFELKKGNLLISELEDSKYVYFIEKGAVKDHYIDKKGNKSVVWFGFEGDLCCSLSAYFNIPHYQSCMELLEDCLFYRIDINFFRDLQTHDLEWANWGRALAENHLVQFYLDMDENRLLNAKERYFNLLEKNKQLVKRVPLKDIASYLGISPISISRFRKEQ